MKNNWSLASLLHLIVFSILSSPTASANEANLWNIDSDSSKISFTVKNMGMNVSGKFNKFSGQIRYNEKNVAASTVNAEINPASIETGIDMRDGHLKSKDFFDSTEFPKIDFHSSNVVVGQDGSLDVLGALTLRGVTNETVLHVKPLGEPKVGKDGRARILTSATAELKRKDYGVGKGMKAITVDNNVDINLTITLVK